MDVEFSDFEHESAKDAAEDAAPPSTRSMSACAALTCPWSHSGGARTAPIGADMFAAPARQASARLSIRISPAYRVMDVIILCVCTSCRCRAVPRAATRATSSASTSWANGAFLSSNLHVPVPFRYNITVSYTEFCIILNSDSVFSRIRNYSIEFTRNSCVEATYAHIIVGTPRESYF
jgi:hypothetical protein